MCVLSFKQHVSTTETCNLWLIASEYKFDLKSVSEGFCFEQIVLHSSEVLFRWKIFAAFSEFYLKFCEIRSQSSYKTVLLDQNIVSWFFMPVVALLVGCFDILSSAQIIFPFAPLQWNVNKDNRITTFFSLSHIFQSFTEN